MTSQLVAMPARVRTLIVAPTLGVSAAPERLLSCRRSAAMPRFSDARPSVVATASSPCSPCLRRLHGFFRAAFAFCAASAAARAASAATSSSSSSSPSSAAAAAVSLSLSSASRRASCSFCRARTLAACSVWKQTPHIQNEGSQRLHSKTTSLTWTGFRHLSQSPSSYTTTGSNLCPPSGQRPHFQKPPSSSSSSSSEISRPRMIRLLNFMYKQYVK
mmetsp:Transcript_42419/g.123259  ORF Transcript_42419/g.123259 Transcript_42419/m.123259 type:complete len:217 (+) Transcript_42419:923-1573(+)